MKKNSEYRDQSLTELEAGYQDYRKQLFLLINERQKQGGQFEKPHRIRQMKKEIARMLTIISEKQRAQKA